MAQVNVMTDELSTQVHDHFAPTTLDMLEDIEPTAEVDMDIMSGRKRRASEMLPTEEQFEHESDPETSEPPRKMRYVDLSAPSSIDLDEVEVASGPKATEPAVPLPPQVATTVASAAERGPELPLPVPDVSPLQRDRYETINIPEGGIDLRSPEMFDWSHLYDEWRKLSKPKYNAVENIVVTYMNKFYAILTQQGGKVLEKCWDDKTNLPNVMERDLQEFTTVMENKVLSYWVGETKKSIGIARMWRSSTKRKEYTRVVFNPYPAGHKNSMRVGEFNRWTGLAYTPEEAAAAYADANTRRDLRYYLEHMWRIMCSGEDALYKYQIRWMASKVQFPWLKLATMCVYIGLEGCGKGIIMTSFGLMFGKFFRILYDLEDVVGKFANMEDTLLTFIDEINYPKNRQQASRLRSFITEEFARAENKFERAKNVRNFNDTLAATNPPNTLPVSNKSRRYFLSECDNALVFDRKLGKEYFDALTERINRNDHAVIKAFQHYLMHEVDLTDFGRGQNPPSTQLLQAMQHAQLDSVAAWWYSCLVRGYHCKLEDLPDNDPTKLSMFTMREGRELDRLTSRPTSPWVREVDKRSFFNLYANSTRSPVTEKTFWATLRMYLPYTGTILTAGKRVRVNGNGEILTVEGREEEIVHRIRVRMSNGSSVRVKMTYIVLPTFKDCCTHFEKATGVHIEFDRQLVDIKPEGALDRDFEGQIEDMFSTATAHESHYDVEVDDLDQSLSDSIDLDDTVPRALELRLQQGSDTSNKDRKRTSKRRVRMTVTGNTGRVAPVRSNPLNDLFEDSASSHSSGSRRPYRQQTQQQQVFDQEYVYYTLPQVPVGVVPHHASTFQQLDHYDLTTSLNNTNTNNMNSFSDEEL